MRAGGFTFVPTLLLFLFQSSPSPKTGCYAMASMFMGEAAGFQSSPGPKTGCYVLHCSLDIFHFFVSILTRPEDRVLRQAVQSPGGSEGVSILTRPEDRVLPAAPSRSMEAPPDPSFQSSPGPKTGCYPALAGGSQRPAQRVESSPGPKTGCYTGGPAAKAGGPRSHSFNPHPARRPGASSAFPGRFLPG